jgi:hypothetical protein
MLSSCQSTSLSIPEEELIEILAKMKPTNNVIFLVIIRNQPQCDEKHVFESFVIINSDNVKRIRLTFLHQMKRI